MRQPAAFLLLAFVISACEGAAGSDPPFAPSSPPDPPPATDPGPIGPTFTISLPVRPGERANNAFGLNPFGVHIGDHGLDGHPGWDVEYALGADVVAVAAGTVQSVLTTEGGQSFGIQITHVVGGREAYRSIYGVKTLAGGVTAGAAIAAGQPLGTVASYTRTIGTITVTYAFTHFQLDDFSANEGSTNPNAVSPLPFLDVGARQAFDAIWRDAVYGQELVEPYESNPRNVVFPMTRVWQLQTGGLTAAIEVTREDAFASTFSYVMRDASGAATETGTVQVEALARPAPTLDLTPSGSALRRRGVYSILDGTMHLDYGALGGARPADLSAAAVYTTF